MNRLKLRESILDSINRKLKNVNINDCTKALLGIVKDRQDGTIFYDYEPRETIGLYIYAELLDKYDEEIGFVLSDDVKESGLLTQAQGACSLDVLISDYKILSVLDCNDAERLREIYEKTINSILDMVIADNGSIFIDATPYNIDVFDSEYAYVDAITWVVSALLGALNFCEDNNKYFESENSGISFSNEVQQRILNVISFCVRYLVECFIDITDKNEKKLSQGWNFTKKCSEPSLYFTYAVSECQLDIYDFFKQVIDKHDIELKIERIKKQYLLENDDDFYLYLSAEDKTSYESINENSEEFKLKKKLFDVINGHENFYYEFSNQVKLAARNAWSLTKDGIDSKFYNGNLSGVIDVSTIESSSSSDALFNNIFVINNVISGAIDEEISDRLAMAVDDDEMNKIQLEYDALLETLQAAVQRIIRYNKTLQSRQKDYIINDFIISCNELFEGDVVKKSQELRKKKIKAFTLSPLLVKTNNLISEFLTKYPQYDMIKYLDELLMKKRSMDDDGNYIWLWEGGEYHITSNYYYLTSLVGFYKYVDAYESRFSAIDHSNESYKASLLDAQLRELRKSGEIFKLTDQTKKLQEANEKLHDQVTELKSQESEVERVIRDLLHREIKENLIVWITEGVTEMKEDVYAHLFDDDFDATHTKEFAFFDSFKKMIVMSFLKTFQERLTYFDLENNRAGDVADLLKRDMEEKYKRLITEIIESPEFNK